MKNINGSFTSSAIHANTAAEAREIIGRTYTADRWTIRRHGKRGDPGRVHCDARYWFQFTISPTAETL